MNDYIVVGGELCYLHMGNTMERKNNGTHKHQFGTDFLTGCCAIILILSVIFILIPLLIFALKVSILIALPIGLVLALVILTAFFGRIINVFRRRW
ncbi:MAG: hypothetical protein BA872_04300 [Desulfobacterales bacterium C00003060]|nr:MAG: hypothetical protein BA861_05755 [Desulfobacterales bacterium S3730MH5]OEU79855.1 MAG: hypothetical protein BA865_08700 [Desulfobacterales bacterium S5133MH4]OEU80586.1 MAG: hypothetical protein BA872_04300 [Desulfobacterales bacterium C00003060]